MDDTLSTLSTGELRQRAFALARERHDITFFWDLVRHLPHAPQAEDVDGSLGSLGSGLDSVLQLWHELTNDDGDYGDAEPLLRARFIDYLSASSKPAPGSDGSAVDLTVATAEKPPHQGGRFFGQDG